MDEHILKNLIQNNVLPTDPTKTVRLIIYYNKFKNLQPNYFQQLLLLH